MRCQGCLGGRPMECLGGRSCGKRWPGHVHRGALSGPPVRTYPGGPQHNRTTGASAPCRRPAGSRGGNPLRDMGNALTVDPWGDRRRGVSRFPAKGRDRAPRTTPQEPPARPPKPSPVRTPPRPGPVRTPAAPLSRPRVNTAPQAPYGRPRPGSSPVRTPREAPTKPNRPGHRALCEARYAGRRQSAEEAGHSRGSCGRVSGPRPGRSRAGPRRCRSGAGGRCGNPAP